MKKLFIHLSILICLSSAQDLQKARAYNAETGEFAYAVELINHSKDKIVFNLKSSVGALIGTKTFNFRDDCPYSPSVESRNFIFPQSSSVEVKGGHVQIQNSENGKKTQARFDNACDLVWDIGIHRFIVDHWGELDQGDLKIELLAPAEGKTFTFILSKISNKVTLTPESMLVKMFVNEIFFEYNSQKQLLRYKGVADMKNSEGNSESVIVKYEALAASD